MSGIFRAPLGILVCTLLVLIVLDWPKSQAQPTREPDLEGPIHSVRDYKIREAYDPAELASQVVEDTDEGWQLLGGVTVEDGVYYQALVRY
jgi:hypothetical protein